VRSAERLKEFRRRWRLTTRVAILAALTSLFVSISVIWTSSAYLESTVRDEELALGREELAEMVAYFASTEGEPSAFITISEGLQENHPGTRFSWRVWRSDDSSWGEFGDLSQLERAGVLPTQVGMELNLGGGFSWFTHRLTDDLVMGLLVNNSEQAELVEQFWVNATTYALVALGLSAAGGLLIGRQAGYHLSKVAENVRSIDALDPSQALPKGNYPVEILNVVDALSEMLQNIRSERGRVMVMTAGLAHELRSPIQNMLGATEVALLRDRDGERYREVLTGQIEELRSLARVVDNLVILCTRKETRGVYDCFDVGTEAGFRIQRERQRAARDSITVELCEQGNLEIEGDREAVMLALANLVENAVYWSLPGDSVVVDLDGQGKNLEITVDDSGPGVPEPEREKIFEAFFQGAVKSREHRIGYGLGLALTRDAVVAHGGRVWVEQSPQGGARFRISLPRSPQSEAA
jgi:signal transduction histidine kinase